MTTYKEPTHGLGRTMLAKHKAGECGWGCPFCKQDEEVAKKEELQRKIAQAPIFEIMPRDVKARGLEFQAGIYSPCDGGHKLIAEVYQTVYAMHIADALTLLASPLFRGIQTTQEGSPPMRVYHILCDPADMERGQPFLSGWAPQGGLARLIHEAAEYIRRQVDPQLDKHRADVMKARGLKGEWGAWE